MRLEPEGIMLDGALLHPQQLIDMWRMEVKARAELEAERDELLGKLRLCANWMHHGGLLEGCAFTEVRRITLPYWDKDECDALWTAMEDE